MSKLGTIELTMIQQISLKQRGSLSSNPTTGQKSQSNLNLNLTETNVSSGTERVHAVDSKNSTAFLPPVLVRNCRNFEF